jgi:hypothetical protein
MSSQKLVIEVGTWRASIPVRSLPLLLITAVVCLGIWSVTVPRHSSAFKDQPRDAAVAAGCSELGQDGPRACCACAQSELERRCCPIRQPASSWCE